MPEFERKGCTGRSESLHFSRLGAGVVSLPRATCWGAEDVTPSPPRNGVVRLATLAAVADAVSPTRLFGGCGGGLWRARPAFPIRCDV